MISRGRTPLSLRIVHLFVMPSIAVTQSGAKLREGEADPFGPLMRFVTP
jgi:hypothetical protein